MIHKSKSPAPKYKPDVYRVQSMNMTNLSARREEVLRLYNQAAHKLAPTPAKRTKFFNRVIVFYAALMLATQLTLMHAPVVGLYVNVISLTVFGSVALLSVSLRKLSISLAIIPVTQMVSSTIMTSNVFMTDIVFYTVLLALVLVYRYLFTLDEPVADSQLKAKGILVGVPLMVLIGQILGIGTYAILRHNYPFDGISVTLVVAACIIFAIAEEMFLRGLVQQQVSRIVHPLLAAFLAVVLYVALAFNNHIPVTLGAALFSGLILAGVYYLKRNVLLCIALNASSKILYVGLVVIFVYK